MGAKVLDGRHRYCSQLQVYFGVNDNLVKNGSLAVLYVPKMRETYLVLLYRESNLVIVSD